MARVKPIRKASDFSGPEELAQTLFATLFPGKSDAEIDQAHDGLAIAAHNPVLALKLAQLSGFMMSSMTWGQRTDLRELAIATINLHFNATYSLRTSMMRAEAAGVSAQMIAALPAYQDNALFNDDQKLTVAYARAVVTGDVPAPLFARMIARFGEAETVECSALISFWSFWALFLGATRPDEMDSA